jgi:hypothetical protein
MVKTGNPYLESGESIILTTDRVRVNTVQYEVILTTRHLILVDTTHTRFLPKMYPLISIQSVKGGKTANGELVISLIFAETASESPGPMVLVFSQQPGEQRISEREEWIKKLMKLIVSQRQERSNDVSPPADDPKTGIMPSMRRTFAPEMSLPFKTAPDTRPAEAEMVIIPDEPENPVFSERTDPEIVPVPQTEGEIPVGSEEITRSADILQPPAPDTVIPLIRAEQVTFSADAPPSAGMDDGIAAATPEEGVLPSDELKFPVQINEEIPEHHEQVDLPPDELQLPVVQVNEEIPEHYEQVALSSDELQPRVQDTEGIPEATEDTIELAEMITPAEVQDDVPMEDPKEEDAGSTPVPVTPTPEEIPPAAQKEEGSPEPSLFSDQSAGTSYNYSPDERTESLAVPPSKGGNAEPLMGQPEEATPPPETPSLPQVTGSKKGKVIVVTAILILVLLLAALVLNFSPNQAAPVAELTPVPTTTVQQTTPVPTQITVPPTGIWVRVGYAGKFYGWLGIPGALRGVNSSGSILYRIPDAAEMIQVNMYTTDYSGNPLSIEVFRDGRVLTNRTVSVPMGFIELLIDAKTGNPPGITLQVTPTANQTGSQGGRILYF